MVWCTILCPTSFWKFFRHATVDKPSALMYQFQFPQCQRELVKIQPLMPIRTINSIKTTNKDNSNSLLAWSRYFMLLWGQEFAMVAGLPSHRSFTEHSLMRPIPHWLPSSCTQQTVRTFLEQVKTSSARAKTDVESPRSLWESSVSTSWTP